MQYRFDVKKDRLETVELWVNIFKEEIIVNAIFFNGMKIEHDKNCINKICKIVQLDFEGGGGYYI